MINITFDFKRFVYTFLIFFIVVAPAKAQKPTASTPNPAHATVQQVSDRINILEERQDLLVEAAQNDLGRMYFIFSAVSAFFALFVVFSAIRSFFDQRRRNRIEDQHMSQLQAMMGSFRDNIGTINSLISSLRETFDVQTDIAKNIKVVDERLQELDQYRQQEEIAFRSKVDSLNTTCAESFRSCRLHKRDRESFKAEENRISLQSVSAQLDTLSLAGSTQGLVSPVSYFLRGLSRFNDMKYQEAIQDLRFARETAKEQLKTPLAQYGNWDPNEVQNNLRVLIDETYYHLGIMYYNTGEWDYARQEFTVAYERYPLDFRSRIYTPELLFFDNTSDPRRTEEEFHSVITELNNVTSDKRKEMAPSWEVCYASLKLRQGNIYLKKMFQPTSRSSVWNELVDNKKALECFWDARSKQESHVINFSLAQAMEYDGKSSLWKDLTPTELFKGAFFKFRNQAIVKTEPILLTLLYYCAAISCFNGQIRGDNPSSYLGLARQHLQRVPETILVFSPLNKIMLSHSNLLTEIDQLERWWQEK